MRQNTLQTNPFVRKLSNRRKNLGISQQSLARMTGISLPTVQRVFAGNPKVSLDNLSKIASTLGLSLTFNTESREEEILAKRARQKAKELAKMVQGTSGLEAQGLDKEALKDVEDKILSDLLKGSRNRLWSD